MKIYKPVSPEIFSGDKTQGLVALEKRFKAIKKIRLGFHETLEIKKQKYRQGYEILVVDQENIKKDSDNTLVCLNHLHEPVPPRPPGIRHFLSEYARKNGFCIDTESLRQFLPDEGPYRYWDDDDLFILDEDNFKDTFFEILVPDCIYELKCFIRNGKD